MALKKRIKKSAYDKLNELFKAEYTENDDGEFVLDIDGDDDVTNLLSAKNHEKQRRLDEAKRRREAEARIKELEEADADRVSDTNKKNGDVEAVTKSWEEKYNKALEERDGQISELKGHIDTFLIDSVVKDLTGEISNAPKLLEPFVRKRLSLDLESDKPSVRVLDANGQPSALTIEELKSEFQENPDYSQIIIGSKASGGGATDKPNATPQYTSGNGEEQRSSDMGIEALTARMEAKIGLPKT